MKKESAYRIALITIVLFALIYDSIPYFRGDPGFKLADYFSFFTTYSNMLVMLVYVLILIKDRYTGVQGAALVCTLISSFGFWILLDGLQGYSDLLGKIVSIIRHGGSSLLVLGDIILFPADRRLKIRSALIWMSYPIIYLVYIYIRASFVKWIPYSFLDPQRVSSFPRLSINIFMLLLVGLIFAFIIVLLERRNFKREQ